MTPEQTKQILRESNRLCGHIARNRGVHISDAISTGNEVLAEMLTDPSLDGLTTAKIRNAYIRRTHLRLIDDLRKTRRFQLWEDITTLLRENEAAQPEQEGRLFSSFVLERVNDCIVDGEQRAVFRFVVEFSCSPTRIAKALDIPVGRAKYALKNIRDVTKQVMGQVQ